MIRSESIKELAAALAKAQGQMPNASKSAANPYFKSVYADMSSIVDAIKKPLSDNGIAYVQTTDTEDGTVTVETTLLHSSGEWLSSQLRMRPVKDDPQGIGSALTYARRYSLQAIVGLAAEDDDGNAATGHTQTASKPKALPAPAPADTPTPANPTGTIEPEEANERITLLKNIAEYAQSLMISADQLHKDAKKARGIPQYWDADTAYLRALEARMSTAWKAKEARPPEGDIWGDDPNNKQPVRLPHTLAVGLSE